ncbi:MAG: pilus assembly protein [Rhodobacteraceae bacterium]|nr:pilus assembly protein [Paracoccaceae bacterium]
MTKSPYIKLASNFLADEDGAVTVDWVMLTAGIVLLAVLVLSGIRIALDQATTDIGAVIVSAGASLT